jgi:UDP-N-acetylmuramyl pentapeptide phosphotransferase/UDP-N-acetylglucosamine-1-phosphate transferase
VTFILAAGQTVPWLLLALVAAAAISFTLTPLVRRVAIRFNAVDLPGHRRVNTSPIPRGGGVAVAVAFIVVTILLLVVNAAAQFMPIRSTRVS